MDKNKPNSKGDPNEPVSKGMLDDAVDTILQGMDNLFSRFQGEVNTRFDKVENRLEKIEDCLTKVEVELGGVKGEIKGLKVELSDTPTKKEFNKLKARVDRYHPSN